MDEKLNKAIMNGFANGFLCGVVYVAFGLTIYAFGSFRSLNKYKDDNNALK